MKYLMIILALISTACKETGHFKKGDCVSYANGGCEDWQANCEIETAKILNVGKRHYQVSLYYSDMPHIYFIHTFDFSYTDRLFTKTECWPNFGSEVGST